MITENKVIEIFCMADDFCKFFDTMMTKYTLPSTTKRKYHRDSTMSKAGAIAAYCYRLHHFSFKPKFKYTISKEYTIFLNGDNLFVNQAFLYTVYIRLTTQWIYFRNRLSGKS